MEMDIEKSLRDAWPVETVDISGRVAAAIEPPPDLLSELRELRRELSELRRTTVLLQDEIVRLRLDLTRRPVSRIAPFAPSEGLVRLS